MLLICKRGYLEIESIRPILEEHVFPILYIRFQAIHYWYVDNWLLSNLPCHRVVGVKYISRYSGPCCSHKL
jgi:hypothetical protein